MSFEFNEEKHEYTLDGERLPSVTEILSPLQAESFAADMKYPGSDYNKKGVDTFTGGKMTFFKDPDGLPIEIHE